MTEKEHVEMRYDDKNKSNHDNQRAWDYVMYMMLTSYFDETNCLTQFWEKKLSLNYRAMKNQDQYAAEDKCIKVIEDEILPKLPEEFVNSAVDVKLMIDEKLDVTVMIVSNDKYELMVSYKYDVKKTDTEGPLRMAFKEK